MARHTTRILVCRITFVVCCALPTCVVAYQAISLRMPGNQRQQVEMLSNVLGCTVRLERASTPRPNTALYENVELLDPENLERLAVLPFVEVSWDGGVATIRLPHPARINGDRLADIWQLAAARMRYSQASTSLRLAAKNLTLHRATGDVSLVDVVGQLASGQDKSELVVDFRPASSQAEAERPARLVVSRHHASAPPATTIQFTTGDTPLPCAPLVALVPGIADIGSWATFAGKLTVHENATHSTTTVSGRFDELDLDRWCRRYTPHHLAGAGRLDVSEAIIRNCRIASASGRLTVGAGQVSNSFVTAAQEQLGMLATANLTTEPVVSFRQLALDFKIDSAGLHLRGACAASPRTVLVAEDGTPVLGSAANEVQSVWNLVRAVQPVANAATPIAKETAWLSDVLPFQNPTAADGEQPLLKARTLGVRQK